MCTCITYRNGDFYFGRNLDLEHDFGERVVITPRNFTLKFKDMPSVEEHYAMIGMASSENSYPLYTEAVNEKGLCAAGLNFPHSAFYNEFEADKKNVAQYELIPWILSQCSSVEETKDLIDDLNVIGSAFAENIPAAPLHWMIADRNKSMVIESVNEGVQVYDNPYGVLTNEPPFSYYREHLNLYGNLRADAPAGVFFGNSKETMNENSPKLRIYGEGLGAVGLPGDYSPVSRFVKAAFLKWNSFSHKDEISNVSQFFHILDSVAMVKGSVITEKGEYDITLYSCCVNADKGVYYYKTYENSRIQAVDLYKENLEDDKLKIFELIRGQDINFINRHNREVKL